MVHWYLFDDPVYNAIYHNYIDEFTGGLFLPELMSARFTDAHNLIQPYVTGRDGEREGYTFINSPGEFEESLDKLINFTTARYAEAVNYLQ